MILKNYGVVLRPMEHKDLSMVLQWRNSNHIRQYAMQKKIINMEEHEKWFSSTQKKKDLYFIVESGLKPVGLIWAKNFENAQCETGFYLYDIKIQNTLLAYKVAITLNSYLFEEKNISLIYCDILTENIRSIRFTLSLGYEKVTDFPDFSHYILNRKAFLSCQNKISRLLTKKA